MRIVASLLSLLILCCIFSGCLERWKEDELVEQNWNGGTEDPVVIGEIYGYDNYEWHITQSHGTWTSVWWIPDFGPEIGGCEGYNETVDYGEFHSDAYRPLSNPHIYDSDVKRSMHSDGLNSHWPYCLVIKPGYNNSKGTITITGWHLQEGFDWRSWELCCLIFLVGVPIFLRTSP